MSFPLNSSVKNMKKKYPQFPKSLQTGITKIIMLFPSRSGSRGGDLRIVYSYLSFPVLLIFQGGNLCNRFKLWWRKESRQGSPQGSPVLPVTAYDKACRWHPLWPHSLPLLDTQKLHTVPQSFRVRSGHPILGELIESEVGLWEIFSQHHTLAWSHST